MYRCKVLAGEIAEALRSLLHEHGHILHDAGFGTSRKILEYKTEDAGIQVTAVNPSSTTRASSGCGSIVPKGWSVRVHGCPDCGSVLDRDVNAARDSAFSFASIRRIDANADPLGRAVPEKLSALAVRERHINQHVGYHKFFLKTSLWSQILQFAAISATAHICLCLESRRGIITVGC